MTAKNFAIANKRVRAYEGGKVDDPQDPGGRTKWGVTQRVYTAYRAKKAKANRDVFLMTEAEATEIYREQYWNAVRGDDLPSGVDLFVYDGAVNSGPTQAVKWLQAAINARTGSALEVDGAMGMVTLEKLAAVTDDDLLIAEMAARRLGFLKRLKTWNRFGRGWKTRVADVMNAAQMMADGSVGAPPPPPPKPVQDIGGAAKAPVSEVTAPAVPAGTGVATSGAGVTGAGVADGIQKAADQVSPLAEVSSILKWVFIALTVAGVGITLFAIYRNWHRRKAIDGTARAEVTDAPEAPA